MRTWAHKTSPQSRTITAVAVAVLVVLSSMVAGLTLTTIPAAAAESNDIGFTQLTVQQPSGGGGGVGDVRSVVVDWTFVADASVQKLVIEVEDTNNETIPTSIDTNPKTIVDPASPGQEVIKFQQKDINDGHWIRVTQVLTDGSTEVCVAEYATSLTLSAFSCTTNLDAPEPLALTTSDGDTEYTENVGPVIIDGTIVVNGSSFDSFQGAQVSINEGFDTHADSLDYDESVVPTDTDGIPIITGEYNQTTGVLEFAGTANAEAYQTLLRTVTYDTSKTPPTAAERNITFRLTAADQPDSDVIYNPGTNHYYEYVPESGATWSAAKTAAGSRTYAGMNGYLATVTSQQENEFLLDKFAGGGWIGASDAASEGEWRWVAGPEGTEDTGDGRVFFDQTAAHVAFTDPYPDPPEGVPGGGSTVDGEFANWNPRHEPDNKYPFFGGEDYAYLCDGDARCPDGMWQDAAASSPNVNPAGYFVEYGGAGATPEQTYVNLTASKTLTISLEPSPNPPTANAGPDQTVNPGDTVSLDAAGSSDPDDDIVRYEWDTTGNGRTDLTGETNTTSFADASNYTVTLTVTDAGGNTDSDTVTIIVTDTNSPTAVISAPDSAERGESISFTGTNSTDDIAIESFEWDFGDGSPTTSAVSPTHGYDVADTYAVTLTVTDTSGNTNTTAHDITITDSARPTLSTITATNPSGQDLAVSLTSDMILDTIEIGVYDTDQLSPRADDSKALQYTLTKNDTLDHFGSPSIADGNYTYANTTRSIAPGNYTIRVETASNDTTGDSASGQEDAVIISNLGPAGMAGDGTAENPFVITNATQLQAMEENLSAHYVLGNDIDASETSNWNGGVGFAPVGKGGESFTGVLDGDGFTITGLYIDRTGNNADGKHVGLFGYIGSGEVRNVSLVDADITGHSYVGGLVGVNNGVLTNVSTSGSVSSTEFRAGGVIGRNFGAISQSFSTATVTSGTYQVGGLIGRHEGGTVTDSYATGAVSGGDAVGGLIGASTASVFTSYSTGTVSGNSNTGGLAGVSDPVVDSYWDTEQSGQTESDSGTGHITAEMTGLPAESNMSGFSFPSPWVATESYPILDWQIDAVSLTLDDGAIEHVGSTNATVTAMLRSGATVTAAGTANYTSNNTSVATVDSTGTISGVNPGTASITVTLGEHSATVSLTVVEGDDTPPTITSFSVSNPSKQYVSVTFASNEPLDKIGVSISGAESASMNETDFAESQLNDQYLYDAPYTGSTTGAYTATLNTAADVSGNDGAGGESDSVSIVVPPAGMEGEGTVENPYIITNVTQLQAMEENLSGHYALGNDIEANDTASWNGGAGFDPVGTCPDSHSDVFGDCDYEASSPFTGSLDGQSYAITNLTIDRPSGTGVGIFGLAKGASFRNLRIVDVNVTGDENVGGLVGHMRRNDSGTSGFVENVSVSGTVTGNEAGESGKVGGVVGLAANANLDNKNVFRGNVTGRYNVGGLVGRMAWDTAIGTSYAQGTVTSTAANNDECDAGNGLCEAGGLAGNSGNPSNITESYAAVTVTGPTIGAIIGADNGADALTNVYWDANVGPADASSGAIDDAGSGEYTGLTTSQMQGDTAPDHMNFDWNDTWQTVPGDYPVFQWEANAMDPVTITGTITNDLNDARLAGASVNSTIDSATTDGSGTYTLNVSALGDAVTATATVDEGFTITNETVVSNPNDVDTLELALGPTYNGSGTQADPYQVATLEDLQQIRYDLGAEYVLTDDIDATATANWFGGGGFSPLGNGGNQFTGTFDGAGYTVTGLTIDRDGTVHVGLFGYLHSSATVESVTLHDVDITGDEYVGGAVGVNDGTIRNVSTTGDVHAATWRAGGLVGRNIASGSVTRSFSTARISSPDQLGGLIGRNHGTVTDSYATGDVVGGATAGGLIGADTGTTTTSYSTGAVSGSGGNVGGLIGNEGAGVSSSYWDIEQSTQQTSSAGTGLTTDQMTGIAAETNMSGFDFSSPWVSTDSYPVLAWQVAGLQLGIDASAINQTDSTNATVTLALHDGSPVTATGPASYATNNSSVATTSAGGRIDGAGVGTANITATHGGYDDIVSLTVEEGDVTAPGISNFGISNPTGQTIEVTLDSNETLDTIDVTVANATSRTLSRGDFTEIATESGYRYTASVDDGTDGTYEATLTAAADTAGNEGAGGERATVTVDTTAPTISDFTVSNPGGQQVAVSLNTTERLATLTIALTGAENATLTRTNATETANGDGTYAYTATFDASTDGAYTATLTAAVDAHGNDGAASESGSTTVNTEPVVASASASSYYVDVGTSVTLRGTDSSVPAGSTPTYEWDLDGDGTTDATGETVSYSFSTPGTHDVTLTVTVGAESDTDDLAVTTVDTTSPTVDLGSDREVAEGTTESFDVSGSSSDNVAITDYEWDFDGDGTTDATGSSATYTFDDPGTYIVTIAVTDAAGNTETDSLRVHVLGPEASVATTALDFGDTATGSSTTQTVAITNTGTTPLDVTGATITGTNQVEFAITGSTTPPLLVKPGQTRSIRVAYSPTATGPASATLTLATNDTDLTSPTIALSGSGVTGDLTGNASTLDFGTVDVGTTATKHVALTNQGGADVDVTAVSITGVDADQYTITDAAGLPTTIASGDTRTLTIEYSPTRTGDQVATLAVETAGGATHTTSLVGEAAGPDISLPAGNLSFEAVGVDNASTETLTVANHGDRDLTIGDVTLTGPNADQFTIEHSPGTISAGSSAPISLNFSPDTAGTHLATLAIESDDPDEPTATHQIVGTAVAPKIGVDNRTLDFGNVSVNETVTMNITVRNLATSKGPLTVDQTHLTGRNPGDFNVTAGGAPFTLAPGESRRLELSFTPLTAGLKEAQLQIISNAGNDPQIDIWLSNSRTYLVVQSIATDDSTSTKRTVNVDANRVAPNGSLSVNVSRPETRLEDVSFDRLNMTVTPGGDFTMNLSHGDAPSDGAVANFSSSATKPVKYVTLTHSLPNADYANTSVAFRVKDSALDSSIDPADVQFHRYSNGTWNAIETTLVRSTAVYHYYAVETPGFSEFVITQPTATSDSPSPPPSQTGTATLAFAATSSVSFGDQFAGTTTTRAITIENTGTASTDIDAVTITGPAGDLYTITDGPTRLAPGESATITVAFTPDRIGQLDATLSLTDEDGTRTSLALTGVSKATVSASNESLSFGNVSVGQSVTKWITISVPAGAPSPVIITSADLVGGDLHDYDVSETQTPFTILPGESRRIAVTHTPSSPGQKTATLRIRTDTPATAVIDIAVSNLDSAIIVRPLTDDAPAVNVQGIRIDADEFLDLNTTTRQTATTDIFVQHLEFTVLREGNFSMNLTHSDTPIGASWPAFTDDSREALKHVELTHTISNADLSDTAVRFQVAKPRLTTIGASPDEVVFYRYDGTRWVAMPTTLVGESGAAYHFRSETPGFSQFLVTAPRSYVHVVDGGLEPDALSVGESTTVTASVWNDRATTTSTTLFLTRNGTTIESRSITLASNETRTVTFTPSFTSSGTFSLTVNDYRVGVVQVTPRHARSSDDADPDTSPDDATGDDGSPAGDGAGDSSETTTDGASGAIDEPATDGQSETAVLGLTSTTVSWLILIVTGVVVFFLLVWRRRDGDDGDENDDLL